jgi:hypothetical protein
MQITLKLILLNPQQYINGIYFYPRRLIYFSTYLSNGTLVYCPLECQHIWYNYFAMQNTYFLYLVLLNSRSSLSIRKLFMPSNIMRCLHTVYILANKYFRRYHTKRCVRNFVMTAVITVLSVDMTVFIIWLWQNL